ncbi:IS4/Tn5 family transposase DNA-binding protein, partial [Shewanella oncorhynchi]
MFLSEPSLWAQSIFQRAQLGDVRRTKRLVQLAAQLAAHTGQSIVQSLSSSADI